MGQTTDNEIATTQQFEDDPQRGWSGHPADPHYDELIETGRQPEYPTNWERAGIEAREFERLQSEPAR